MDPLLKKLQHKSGPLVVVDAPDELAEVVARWSNDGIDVQPKLSKAAGFVLAFVRSCADIEKKAPKIVASLDGDDAILWMAYPKKSSKRYSSDVGRDDSWQALGDLGFEPVRQIAVDEDWSALRFRRVEKITKLTRSRALSTTGKERLQANARAAER